MARARVISEEVRVLGVCRMSHSPVRNALEMLANSSVAEAVAWAKKYLVVASVARGVWFCDMRGIMANVLISIPIQARYQWVLAKVMVVPSPRLIIRAE